MEDAKGSLICVGTGMMLAGQISVVSRNIIKNAEVVFSLMPDGFTQQWLGDLNNNIVNLQRYYAQHGEVKNRRVTYQQMVDVMLVSVRRGQRVVGAFYGHPGIFACVPHMAIAQAKKEGFYAKMEPGISAEACLWSDLGIDPGTTGHQSFEASQFMFYDHIPDPKCHLLLWQIGIAGEHTLTKFNTSSDKLNVLVEHLYQWYREDHQVVVYEAANLPTQSPRVTRFPLADLPQAELTTASTLLIPPAEKLRVNQQVLAKLGITQDDLG